MKHGVRFGTFFCHQLLQANPLLETERKLFVHFFTEPGKLSRTVSDLARRVDSIALANK